MYMCVCIRCKMKAMKLEEEQARRLQGGGDLKLLLILKLLLSF